MCSPRISHSLKWYVICTKPMWELKVYKTLLERGIEGYCPTYTEVRQWSDRKKKIRKPYFNGYIFVRLQEADRNLVFSIPGVVRYVFWQGKAARVQESEIQLMKEFLDGEAIGNARMENFTVGEKVTFAQGVLKERTAFVEEIGQHSIRLVLPVLGYKVTARIVDLVP